MQTIFASTVLAFAIAACGGSNLDPGAGNDPGKGTSTLAIEGSVHASPRGELTNARTSAEFDTDFSVRVSLNSQTVTTGTITVTSATGKVPLTYRDNSWSGEVPGYDEVYILDIESGPDQVTGVRVDGPDIHVFSAPTAGAIVDPTVPLMVKWDREDEADTAAMRAENIDKWISIPDSGSYALAAGALRTDTDQARQNTLRLTRTNHVIPSGAVAGSMWSVEVENEINVVTEAQPL